MKFVLTPHIPTARVTHLFANKNITAKIKSSLQNLGITPVYLSPSRFIDEPVASHPDMLALHKSANRWAFYESVYTDNKAKIDSLGLDVTLVPDSSSRGYPSEAGLNILSLGNNIFAGKTASEFFPGENFNFIKVNQGYAKCSVCVVGENAAITADKGLHTAMTAAKIDSLLISPGNIAIEKYSCGFIGGAAALIDAKTLAISGTIDHHPDKNSIEKFCRDRGVGIIYLSDERVFDYGGFLPILQRN